MLTARRGFPQVYCKTVNNCTPHGRASFTPMTAISIECLEDEIGICYMLIQQSHVVPSPSPGLPSRAVYCTLLCMCTCTVSSGLNPRVKTTIPLTGKLVVPVQDYFRHCVQEGRDASRQRLGEAGADVHVDVASLFVVA